MQTQSFPTPVKGVRSRISLLMAAAFLAAVAAACVYLTLSPSTPGETGLIVEEPIRHLGQLGQGEPAHATFKITNRFDQQIEIINVIKSCGGCSDIELSSRELAGGESATLNVLWKTGESRGQSGFNLWVVYKLADSRQGSIKLRVEGEVVPDINFDPPELVFEPGRDGKRILRLSPGRLKEFTIDQAFCTQRAFRATVRHDLGEVEVFFDASQWPDDIPGALLVLVTSSPNQPRSRIGLFVRDQREATRPKVPADSR